MDVLWALLSHEMNVILMFLRSRNCWRTIRNPFYRNECRFKNPFLIQHPRTGRYSSRRWWWRCRSSYFRFCDDLSYPQILEIDKELRFESALPPISLMGTTSVLVLMKKRSISNKVNGNGSFTTNDTSTIAIRVLGASKLPTEMGPDVSRRVRSKSRKRYLSYFLRNYNCWCCRNWSRSHFKRSFGTTTLKGTSYHPYQTNRKLYSQTTQSGSALIIVLRNGDSLPDATVWTTASSGRCSLGLHYRRWNCDDWR